MLKTCLFPNGMIHIQENGSVDFPGWSLVCFTAKRTDGIEILILNIYCKILRIKFKFNVPTFANSDSFSIASWSLTMQTYSFPLGQRRNRMFVNIKLSVPVLQLVLIFAQWCSSIKNIELKQHGPEWKKRFIGTCTLLWFHKSCCPFNAHY